MALATNSEELRIVSIGADSTYFGADVTQLRGHDDIIVTLSVDWSGHWIATGAKDNTARLWRGKSRSILKRPESQSIGCRGT